MEKQLSIYVHIPFCARKCLYCDFLSFNAGVDVIESYFFALGKEIAIWADQFKDKEYEVISVFFGGGTPSFVDAEHIAGILELIKSKFIVREDAEITIEANPSSAMYEKLLAYRKAGINRLSIGAQSFNDEELKRLGRLHDSRMFFETFENARKAGFDNINIDIMSALPGQNLDSYLDTVKKVTELRPEHISAYSLIVEEGTPFFDMDLDLPDEETDREMYHKTLQILSECGYHRYEISNYALGKEYECRHNKVYWQRGNYLGVGLGAASMVENKRWSNLRNIERYVGAFSDVQLSAGSEADLAGSEADLAGSEADLAGSEGDLAGSEGDSGKYRKICRDISAHDSFGICENIENLTLNSQMEEYMFLGLRLTEGVSIKRFKELFSLDIRDVYGQVIDKYEKMALLAEDGDHLKLTEKGLDVSNTVMAEFILEE